MKISVDNQVVRLFSFDADKVMETPLKEGRLDFCWPSLLEYLELGDLLARFPSFDEKQPLFKATISALCEVNNPEDLFYVYDSLFTKMLEQVKALPEVNALFLLKKIEEKKDKLSFLEMERVLAPSLALREKALKENAPEAMHDLILYLAWDRMCVSMGRLFDYQLSHPKFLQNLKALKWCLVESYQHIIRQGKTTPSLYRMVEALFYYQMREEHLELHPEEDWALLTHSFSAVTSPDELMDCFYIDHAAVPDFLDQGDAPCHLTLDSPEQVEQRLALAQYIIDHLKEEIPHWNYALRLGEIVHI